MQKSKRKFPTDPTLIVPVEDDPDLSKVRRRGASGSDTQAISASRDDRFVGFVRIILVLTDSGTIDPRLNLATFKT